MAYSGDGQVVTKALGGIVDGPLLTGMRVVGAVVYFDFSDGSVAQQDLSAFQSSISGALQAAVNAEFANNLQYLARVWTDLNSPGIKEGDFGLVGTHIHQLQGGAWRQIYPPVWSA